MIVERELLKVPGSSDVELLRVVGSQPGPTLAVLGGVHGDEPEGVFAAWRLFAEIQRQELHGTVLIVPVASPEAFAAGTRLSPLDGGNLARSFPGSPTGTATERLASLLAARVIAACDLLVDLHAAGRDYRMPFFAGAVDDGSPTGAASAAAARAFAAPLTWLHDAMNPGRTISAAWDRGIPSVYVESGGGGSLSGHDVDAYVTGVLAVMAHLHMTPGQDAPRRVDGSELHGDTGDVDAGLRAPVGGCLIPEVGAGNAVRRGEVIARLWIPGDEQPLLVESPRDGTVMMIRWRSQILAEELVAMLGPLTLSAEPQ